MSIDALGPKFSTLTNILNQSTIPFTMLLSRLMLRTTYTGTELLGAAVVVAGVAVSVAPGLDANSSHQPGGGSASASAGPLGATEGATVSASALWVAVYVLSCLPLALLNVSQAFPLYTT